MTADEPLPQVSPVPRGSVSISPEVLLDEIFELAKHWAALHEQEVTKREAIRVEGDADVAEIHARRDVFITHLDRSFDERRDNFRELFVRLDRAMEAGPEEMSAVLAAITTLALRSPFADLADPVMFRQKVDDPEAEWEV